MARSKPYARAMVVAGAKPPEVCTYCGERTTDYYTRRPKGQQRITIGVTCARCWERAIRNEIAESVIDDRTKVLEVY